MPSCTQYTQYNDLPPHKQHDVVVRFNIFSLSFEQIERVFITVNPSFEDGNFFMSVVDSRKVLAKLLEKTA